MPVSKLRRLATWLIDLLCILLLFAGAVHLRPAPLPAEALRWLLLGIAFAYYALSELAVQRTVGKWLTRTAVVTTDDEKPGPGRVLLRSLCRFLPLEPFSLLFSNKGLSWHDAFSGTKVVSFGY